MKKVLFLPEVVEQFLEVAEVLYQKGYLGFKEVAVEYSERLFKDIQTNLPLKVKKDAPSYFKRYGNDLFYSSFAANKHTTWYVFYSIAVRRNFYHKVSCLFESSSGTLTGSSGLL